MAKEITKRRLPVQGMTCQGCERRIQRVLSGLPGVVSVRASYQEAAVTLEYHPQQTGLEVFFQAIEKLGYMVEGEPRSRSGKYSEVAGVALLILAVYLLLRHTGLLGYLSLFPTAEAGMDYGMLFVIGLLTSVHCIAMCGGINLTQCLPACPGEGGASASFRPGLLYNLGRVVSYTVVGALVGALGSVLRFSGFATGVVQLLAGVFMVLMGINMLGLFPGLRRLVPRLPGKLGNWVQGGAEGKGPLIVGLLNGLMPCGPLQAMQLYALSTGHPLKGALSMLLFSLGTVPLMLGLSVFSASMSRRFTHRVMTVGAVLVVILGISMVQNGMALSGVAAGPIQQTAGGGGQASAGEDGVQVVNTELSPYGYPAITVEAGRPVRWTITAAEGSITGCNRSLQIPEYGLQKQLVVGDNVIEFTPESTGVFPYSCWMGMIRSTITVTGDGEIPGETEPAISSRVGSLPRAADGFAADGSGMACCQ